MYPKHGVEGRLIHCNKNKVKILFFLSTGANLLKGVVFLSLFLSKCSSSIISSQSLSYILDSAHLVSAGLNVLSVVGSSPQFEEA